MRHHTLVIIGAAVVSIAAVQQPWRDRFEVPASELSATGRNPYFILEPGSRQTLADGKDRLVITVLNETKTINGVNTRVVEEREWEDGALVEVSRNYFAISTKTHDVYYFGEDVDIYKNGKIVKHEGAWHAGEHGARYGLAMPADPKPGTRYYQELAPGVAMDRAEIVSTSRTVDTPAGRFTDVLETRETSALEKGAESKYYARGVGLIREENLRLVK